MSLPAQISLRPIPWVTPTMAEELSGCMLRAAFRADPAFRVMRRSSIPAILGTVSHRMAEQVATAAFDGLSDTEIRPALEAEWGGGVSKHHQQLQAAAQFGEVPLPAQWPGYQLIRVRTLRRLEEEVLARHGDSDRGRSTEIEQRLEDPRTGLAGTPDRVEVRDGGEIVDLKTGWRVSDEISPSHRRQLLLYAYLWHNAHGKWPARMSVQRLDGVRVVEDVHPAEAMTEAAEAQRLGSKYGALVSGGATPQQLARVSEEQCRDCDYSGACDPFLHHRSDGWAQRRRTVAGLIASAERGRTGAVIGLSDVTGGASHDVARVIVPRLPDGAETGRRCSFVGLLPVSGTDDFHVDWQTRFFVRD